MLTIGQAWVREVSRFCSLPKRSAAVHTQQQQLPPVLEKLSHFYNPLRPHIKTVPLEHTHFFGHRLPRLGSGSVCPISNERSTDPCSGPDSPMNKTSERQSSIVEKRRQLRGSNSSRTKSRKIDRKRSSQHVRSVINPPPPRSRIHPPVPLCSYLIRAWVGPGLTMASSSGCLVGSGIMVPSTLTMPLD